MKSLLYGALGAALILAGAVIGIAQAATQADIDLALGSSPGIPDVVTAGAATAAASPAYRTGACLRFSCTADAQYRMGTAPVALSTDNELPAKTIEKLCLQGAETKVSFISAAAWTCKVALLKPR